MPGDSSWRFPPTTPESPGPQPGSRAWTEQNTPIASGECPQPKTKAAGQGDQLSAEETVTQGMYRGRGRSGQLGERKYLPLEVARPDQEGPVRALTKIAGLGAVARAQP